MRREGEVIRVLLADEQSLFREAVHVILEREPDLEVVGEAADGLQAVSEAERLGPDVVFLDVDLPNCDGLRATSMLQERLPACAVVVIDGQEDETTLAEALRAGAAGYISKTRPLSELIDAARTVHRGETLVPPGMLRGLLGRLFRQRSAQDEALRAVSALTRREREVLALLAEGADNDGIAQVLVISPQTARTHIQNVLGKLGVHSRLEAAMFVTQNGLIEDLVSAGGPERSAAALVR
jgi:two-component system, NarL family, response regulator NreC